MRLLGLGAACLSGSQRLVQSCRGTPVQPNVSSPRKTLILSKFDLVIAAVLHHSLKNAAPILQSELPSVRQKHHNIDVLFGRSTNCCLSKAEVETSQVNLPSTASKVLPRSEPSFWEAATLGRICTARNICTRTPSRLMRHGDTSWSSRQLGQGVRRNMVDTRRREPSPPDTASRKVSTKTRRRI